MLGSNELPVGSELLGYRIEGVLGRGGMGIVYLAQDLRLKRSVALKLLSPGLAADEGFRLRLRAESELAASLDHPNIVPIYEVLESDFGVGISMRFVEGKDLKAALRNGPLPAEQTLSIVSQVASALDAAHGRGLVHRDVKPSNVLIAPHAGHEGADHAYLADFGLSKRLLEEPDGASPSRSDHLTGTVEYVAPEQIRGEDVDGRADVYSLGCLLFECLVGKPPYSDASDTAVLFAHLQSEPPTLPGLEQVLPKALAKSPENRYQTCRELVESARKALGLAESGRTRRRQRVAIAGVVVTTVAVLVAAFLVKSAGTPALAAPGRLIRIDPRTNGVVGTASMGQDPTGVAVGAGRVWMTTVPDSSVWRVDPRTLAMARSSVNGTPVGIAVRGAVAYVAGSGGATRIVASSGQVTGLIKTPGDATTIASGRGGVWFVASDTAYRLADVSVVPPLGAGRIDATVPIPSASPLDENHVGEDQTGMAVGEGGVWVLGDAVDRRLFAIDPRTATIRATIRLPFAPGGVAAGLGGVWVTAQLGDRVVRIDPRTRKIVATIVVGRAPWGVAVGEGAVWVANTIDGTVSRVDPSTNRVVATIRVGADPKEIAVGEGSVWLAGVAG